MPNLLQSYNPIKIKLVFHGYDLKVEESNKSIALNQYANSLFISFSIDSPEYEDKKVKCYHKSTVAKDPRIK